MLLNMSASNESCASTIFFMKTVIISLLSKKNVSMC